MDSEKHSRLFSLLCSTCGGRDFEYDDETGPLRCTLCDRTYTREELIRENGANIEAEVEVTNAAIVRDAQKEMRDTLRKAFSGSKYVKFK